MLIKYVKYFVFIDRFTGSQCPRYHVHAIKRKILYNIDNILWVIIRIHLQIFTLLS